MGCREYVRGVPQRAQNVRLTASDDLYVARNESIGATLGAKTSEAEIHFLSASSLAGSTRTLVSMGSGDDRNARETLIISIGVQSPARVRPAVARRQSLQWQMTINGRWTGTVEHGWRGYSETPGTLILYLTARQLQPPLIIRASGEEALFLNMTVHSWMGTIDQDRCVNLYSRGYLCGRSALQRLVPASIRQ